MNFKNFRTSVLASFATVTLLGMAAGGACAAEPVVHDSGTTSSTAVIHVSGTHTVSQTIHESMTHGGALLGFGV